VGRQRRLLSFHFRQRQSTDVDNLSLVRDLFNLRLDRAKTGESMKEKGMFRQFSLAGNYCRRSARSNSGSPRKGAGEGNNKRMWILVPNASLENRWPSWKTGGQAEKSAAKLKNRRRHRWET